MIKALNKIALISFLLWAVLAAYDYYRLTTLHVQSAPMVLLLSQAYLSALGFYIWYVAVPVWIFKKIKKNFFSHREEAAKSEDPKVIVSAVSSPQLAQESIRTALSL